MGKYSFWIFEIEFGIILVPFIYFIENGTLCHPSHTINITNMPKKN